MRRGHDRDRFTGYIDTKRAALTINIREVLNNKVSGLMTDIQIHAKEILSLKERLNKIYSKHTGKSITEISDALERDNFMTADVAQSFGLIDEVVEKRS